MTTAADTVAHPCCCCLCCREESDGKINTNLIEQKMRSFSTKVFRKGGRGWLCLHIILGHGYDGSAICIRIALSSSKTSISSCLIKHDML
jgi:hypothetical protein